MLGLGKNIKALRKDRKLTQDELGIRLGYSQRTISDWERNASEPNVEAIRKIVQLFNITVDDLFDEGDPTENA
ncbi:MAG: helix-turn-helix transcriptional regulator [Clostridia bacterium]|nr:helix-turn-helix transcriptional regulator [Clostridia bacterium]